MQTPKRSPYPSLSRAAYFLAVVGLAVSVVVHAAAASAAVFTPLGTGSVVPPAGQRVGSVPTDLSADGSVVVGYVYTSSDVEFPEGGQGFRWEDGELETLTGCSIANSVSADGTVIAGKCQEDEYWRDGQFVSAGVWDPQDGGSIEIVSGDGNVLYGARTVVFQNEFLENIGLPEAYVFAPETARIGPLPGDKSSTVVGTSFDGSVAALVSRVQSVEQPESDILSAVQWNGALNDIGTLGQDVDVFPIDISSDGSTIIGFNGPTPWRWTEDDGMVAIDFPEGGNIANARGVNEDGTMIVGAWAGPNAQGGQRAYIWTSEDGSRDLEEYFEDELDVDLKGWHLLEATVISDDGSTIAGIGLAPDSDVITGWRVGEGCELRIEVAPMFVPYAAAPSQYQPAAGGDYPPGST